MTVYEDPEGGVWCEACAHDDAISVWSRGEYIEGQSQPGETCIACDIEFN